MKIVERDNPIRNAKTQNIVCAREADMFLIPNDIYITIPRGAKATTHIIGPVYKVTPKLVRPTISPVGLVTAVA